MTAYLGNGAIGPVIFGTVVVGVVLLAHGPACRLWRSLVDVWLWVVDVVTNPPAQDMVGEVEAGRYRATVRGMTE